MIPQGLYDKILASMPITGLEAMIMRGNAVLLMKRRNDPVKGEWWFPGGRLRKGESFEAALRREVKEETGLDVETERFIGVYNRIFPDRHDVTLAFLCKTKDSSAKIMLNEEHSGYVYATKVPSDLHAFIVEVIRDSGMMKV